MPTNEMTPLTDVPATVAMVTRYYDEPTRRLQFLCAPVRPEDAAALVAAVPRYNSYDGSVVAYAVRDLDWTSLAVRVRVGREYGPVVYVDFVAPPTRSAVAQATRILAQASPDELDYDEATHSLRACWD